MQTGSMDLGDLNKVWEIKPLKKIGEDEAGRILERVAKQVQPIMKKHKWRVKLLSEFCPTNSSLLGLNEGGGVQVKLRLRRPNRDWEFFPYEQILDTMLHELCHNEHGPHNASFYKLWDEIRKECEELMAKGITGTGQGFDVAGRRLGGYSRAPPLSSLRQTALAAAERRARASAIFPVGPKRLGGDSDIMSALSPIQAAAMAAERRLQDDLWCGSQSIGVFSATGGSSKNSSTAETSISKLVPANTAGALSVSDSEDVFVIASSSRPVPDHSQTEKNVGGVFWECGICTLLNQELAPVCEACGTSKPKDVGTKFRFWSCKFCTLDNSVELERCSACQQWRYSYGAPVATHGPNIGT